MVYLIHRARLIDAAVTRRQWRVGEGQALFHNLLLVYVAEVTQSSCGGIIDEFRQHLSKIVASIRLKVLFSVLGIVNNYKFFEVEFTTQE